MGRTSPSSDHKSCHIQNHLEPEQNSDTFTSNAAVSRKSGQLVSEGSGRWLPGSGNGTCGIREQADVPHFVFSTDPCGKASRTSGLQFATVGESSGQMSVAVGTRDIWGCDSWRKGTDDGLTTKSAVARQGQTGKTRRASVTVQPPGQAAMGAPARWAKSTIKASEAEV